MRKLLLNAFLAFSSLLFAGAINAQAILQESFEGGFPPSGWTLVNAGSGNPWQKNATSTYSYDGTSSMVYNYEASGTYAANAWAFTPALALNTNPVYISFFVRVRSASYPEALKFTVGSSNTVASQTNVLLDSSNIDNTTFRRWSTVYTPSSAGTFYFGFNAYSLADQWQLFVDSITFTQVQPACSGSPTGGTINVSPEYMCSGGNVNLNLSGATAGPGISYQFQSSPAGAGTWSDIGPSGPSNSYVETIAASTDFRVKVTCANGGAISYSTVRTAVIGSVPANDDVCSAMPLTLNAAPICGNTTCATSVGDPTFSASTPNNTVWYTYTPATSGPVQVRLKRPAGVGSGFLYAWTGFYTASGTCPSLSFTEVTGSALAYDLRVSDSVSNVTFSMTAGTTYYIMLDGFFVDGAGSFGAYCLQLLTPPTPPACVMNVSPANSATNRPVNDTLRWNKAPGSNITYDIYFGNTPTPTLQNVPNYSDTSIPVNGMNYSTTYYWYVVPKNQGSPATGCSTNMTSFTTQAPPPPPANDECVNATEISQYAGPVNATTISATQSMAAEVCATFTSTTAEDVWFKFTALFNGNATIALTNPQSTFDAVMHAYSGTCGSLVNIGCADATVDGGNETLNLTGLVAGQTYYVRVYSYNTGTQGTFRIGITGTALPVSITQFFGTKEGKTNRLSWTTASEVNNLGFELQRSADGKNFSMLEFVNTKAFEGNSSSALNYEFVDERPLSSDNYYRLKQIDRDGKSTYSNTVLLKGSRSGIIELVNVYPNPVVERLSVIIKAPANDKVNVTITDLAGKVVLSQQVQLVNGDNNISVDVSKLSAGSYVIKTICDSGCETSIRKFVKQ